MMYQTIKAVILQENRQIQDIHMILNKSTTNEYTKPSLVTRTCEIK